MDELGGQTVVVIGRTVDTDGDQLSESVVATVPGCSVQPGSTSEDVEGREQSRAAFDVYGPPALVVARAHHLLQVDGWVVGSDAPSVRLSMTGNAALWPDEDGQPHHTEIRGATRVTG